MTTSPPPATAIPAPPPAATPTPSRWSGGARPCATIGTRAPSPAPPGPPRRGPRPAGRREVLDPRGARGYSGSDQAVGLVMRRHDPPVRSRCRSGVPLGGRRPGPRRREHRPAGADPGHPDRRRPGGCRRHQRLPRRRPGAAEPSVRTTPTAIASASRLIAEAAQHQPADGNALGVLNQSLVAYTSQVEQARANNRQALPVGAQYLRGASADLRADALPLLKNLGEANTGRVAEEFDRAASGGPLARRPRPAHPGGARPRPGLAGADGRGATSTSRSRPRRWWCS